MATAADTGTMATTQHEVRFSLTVEDDRDPTVMRVEGDLDSSSAAELREGFARVLGRPGTIVDVREVTFVDSAGLGALLGGIRRVREAGGTVVLCCTRPSVLRLLSVTGVDRAVTVTRTPAEAGAVIAAARMPTLES